MRPTRVTEKSQNHKAPTNLAWAQKCALLLCLFALLFHPPTTTVAHSNFVTDCPLLLSVTPEEVIAQEVPSSGKSWLVTTDEYQDTLGNAASIARFCADHWSDAYWWLRANYSGYWPHGPIKEDRAPIDLGWTIGMAIAANAMRESSCIPNTLQGGRSISPLLTATEVTNTLLSYGSSSGRAWGIIQWDGGRRYNFVRFCQASGVDPRSLEVQLHYMAYEYYASNEYKSYQRLVNWYLTADSSLASTKDAAEVFRADVERGGIPNSSNSILMSWGNKWNDAWGAKPAGGLYTYLNSRR